MQLKVVLLTQIGLNPLTLDNNTKIQKSNKKGYNSEPISEVKQPRKA